MEQLINEVKQSSANYCKGLNSDTSGSTSFDLQRDITGSQKAVWFGSDVLSWLSNGRIGTDRAYIFGSFYLDWAVSGSIKCENGIATADIAFYANDTLRIGSALRLPWDKSRLPDNPFGRNRPFNNVRVRWFWIENISQKYSD
jgi:hypothetical protein